MLKKMGIAVLMTTLAIAGCGKKEAAKAPAQAANIPPLRLVVSSGDKYSQILQSQWKKAGITVEIVEKKDSSTLMADMQAGSFDMVVTGWTTVTGNPDYAVMSLFHTNGDYNRSGISDATLDKALEDGRAAEIGSAEFKKAYGDVEKIVNEKSYIIPLVYSQRNIGFSKNLTNVVLAKSRSFTLEKMEWAQDSGKNNESTPVYGRHATINLTSFDPAKANDGTVFPFNTNIYARLVNLDPDDGIVPGLATQWYSPDQKSFYFVLRDAKFSNGDKITGNDIVFSLKRASDKTMKDNKVYTIQGNMESVKTIQSSEVPADIKAHLEKNGSIDGKEIIEITTFKPYGQLYNMLAHTSGGIVSEKAVKAAGDSYGSVTAIDTIVASGPYLIKNIDKQKNEIVFEKNDNYYEPAKIKTVIFKAISDNSSALLALQSGSIDFLYTIPEDSRAKVINDPKLNFLAKNSNGFTYVLFNIARGENKATFNEDLRKALYYAVDPNEVLSIVLDNNGGVGASPLSPVVAGSSNETGYARPKFDLEKSKEYMDKYIKSQSK